jgi:hypothetical protein
MNNITIIGEDKSVQHNTGFIIIHIMDHSHFEKQNHATSAYSEIFKPTELRARSQPAPAGG